jgi:ferric-dicitrate binding protein FerR (iron transport regulator)
MEKKLGAQLVEKYLSGTATPRERSVVEEWYAFNRTEEAGIHSPKDFIRIKSEMWAAIDHRLYPQVKIHPQHRWLSYAAAILFIVCFFGIYKWQQDQREYEVATYAGPVIKGGHSGATLTLSDGSEIDLNAVNVGEVMSREGLHISKNQQGVLVYTADKSKAHTNSVISNTITTRNGEMYQVILPDGSKAWLNAASRLTFDSNLASSATRTVYLQGEGYFEVSKNTRPFIVATASQRVHVLGTHFNINAYAESKGLVKTTLIEGKVNVVTNRGQTTIRPGEQAINRLGQVNVHEQDTEEILAWKNGFFKVDGNLQDVMLSIGRWYDMEVQFAADAPKEFNLWGYISRSNDLITTLRQIERTNKVKFKIKERTIIVTN